MLEVTTELTVSQSVISRCKRRHRETGRVTERHRSGRPLATSHAEDRCIENSALWNQMMNATQLQAREVRGTQVSRQTIRNHLHQHGLRARHRNQWPLLSGVTIWAGVSSQYRTALHLVNGTVTSQYCLNNIIQSLCLCMSNTGLISSSWMTMPDHRGRIIRERLEAGVTQTEWPALSSDLNPSIENPWDHLIHGVDQGSSNLALEIHFPAEFGSNPNQTHLSMLINVFKIIRKSQVGEFDQGWS
uniref:Transposase Tc1-like domain-containing protein n=1 Tax=Sinocyclocheilus grahami TaxID=75366 RepID=A0A672N3I9_SINGR